ncbi:MAG TPA: lamin tail domain-containing protein [Candidatus Krumholzibacteria bacterium]|nr:lamin tail domain-containing protein [Candidatus Krumholzibacteria bacterium]
MPRFPTVLCLLLTAVAWRAPAAPLLNEVLYDPEGADGGHEFVELFNPADAPLPLAGVALEFANGAVGDVWSVRWTGAEADTLPPRGLWLIADRGWAGPADAVASLGLQNGPDAVRLRRGETVLDLLGYGALVEPALFEGAPHPGSGSGASLARRPDGADTDDNAADWSVAAEPTPGAYNMRLHSLRILESVTEPPCRFAPARPFTLTATLENDGQETWPGGLVALRDAAGDLLTEAAAPALASGAAGVWRGVWSPRDTGLVRPVLHPVSGGAELSLALPPLRVGVPRLTLREVLPAPEPGAPEWVEVRAEGEGPLDLGGWTLADEGGAPRALPERLLVPGERLVLCADPQELAGWYMARLARGAPEPCAVDPSSHADVLAGGWPVLNNTAATGEPYADRLLLRGPDGVVADWVAWDGGWPAPAPGRSLERVSVPPRGAVERSWAPSPAAFGSTPGCPDAAAASTPTAGGLALSPALIPAGGGTALGFALSEQEASWDLRVLSPEGATVRRLGGDALGPGPRALTWDGTDDRGLRLPPGPRVILLRVRDAEGRLRRRAAGVVVLDRERP